MFSPLDVHSDPAITAGSLLWTHGGAMRASVVAKATLAMVPQGAAQWLAPEALIENPMGRGVGPAGLCDVVPFLPAAGVTLFGSVYALAPTQAVSARIALFREQTVKLDKTLHVYGPSNGAAGPVPTRASFQRKRLTHEDALAGPANPKGRLDPTIIDAQNPQNPGTFGPIPAQWTSRTRLCHTANAEAMWLPLPTVPDGFDFRYFHAAPIDQQIEYLVGDEWLILDGLHPAHARLSTQLPNIRVHARLSMSHAGVQGEIRDLQMVLDQLHLDTDRHVLSLVWRGTFELGDSVDRVKIWAAAEAKGRPLVWPPEAQGVSAKAPPRRIRHTESMQRDDLLAMLNQPATPFEASSGGEFAPTAVLSDGEDEMPTATMEGQRKEIRDVVREHVSQGRALDGLALAGADLSNVDFRGIRLTGLDFTGANIDGCTFAGTDSSRCRFDNINATKTDFTDANLTASSFVGCQLTDVNFEETKIDNTNFEGAVLVRCSFSASLGTSPRFHKTKADGINFDGARLAKADFTGAELSNATARRASLDDSIFADSRHTANGFQHAKLSRVRFSGATLTDCDLAHANIEMASFARAALSQCNLSSIAGDGCLFGQATLREVLLNGATLTNMSLAQTTAERCDFSGADLEGADLKSVQMLRCKAISTNVKNVDARRADLSDSDFSGSCLDHSGFQDAQLARTNLGRASLVGTNFKDANLAGAKLTETDRTDTVFTGANLTGTVWET